MKKTLCLLLAAVMLLSLCACGKEIPQTHNDAGYYRIFSLNTGGKTLTQDDLAALGKNMFLQLDEAGTGVLDLGSGDPASLAWHDGVIRDGTAEYSYVLAGGMLTLDMSDSNGTLVAIFQKVDPDEVRANLPADSGADPLTPPAGASPSAAAAGVSSDSLVGTYRLTGMTGGESDENLDEAALALMESLGLTVRLYIESDGTGELNMYGESIALTWSDSDLTVEGESTEYTFADGVLSIAIEGTQFLTFEKISDTVDKTAGGATAEPEAGATEPLPAVTGVFDPVAGDLGSFHVEILSAEPFRDIDGKEAVRFYYDFTNNSDAPVDAYWELDFDAVEDGASLDTTYASYEDDVLEYGNDDLFVLPGVTIRCIAEFSYRPDGKELVFTITDDDDRELKAAFDPAALPGRPGDWSISPIEDPDHFSDYADEGSSDYARVYIDRATRADGDGWLTEGKVIRVFFDYTNLMDKSSYLRDEHAIKAYQDGVELLTGYPAEELDSDGADYTDVDPGESLSLSLCWELRSESPIEIVVSDWSYDEILCAATFYFNS